MHWGSYGSDQTVCFWGCFVFKATILPLSSFIGIDWSHVEVRTAGNENSSSNGTMLSDVFKFHEVQKTDLEKSAHSHTLFPHILCSVFAVTMRGTSHATGLCSQSVSQSVSQEAARQAGRCCTPICFLSWRCLLSAHRSPEHVTHTNTHAHIHTRTQQHHTSSVVIQRQRREKEEEEWESIYLFRKETLGEIFSYFDGYTPHEYFLFSLWHYRQNNIEHSSVYLWD